MGIKVIGSVASHMRFRLERLLIRGPLHQLVLIVIVIIGLSVVCGGLYYLSAEPKVPLHEAVWWAFLRLTDPGYLGDDEGAFKRIISTFLTVAGYVVFLGALIAIMTQSLYQSLRRLESGLTPITAIGHIVILGYVEATPSIVRNLFAAGSRLSRFLRRADVSAPMVAILHPDVSYGLADDLKAHLKESADLNKTIFRSGSLLRDDDLDRINVDHASVVIVPADDRSSSDALMADARTIKALHSIHSRSQLLGKQEPTAVAEIYDRRMEQVAKNLYGSRLNVVASNRFIAQVIAHCMVEPGFAVALPMLLSVGELPGLLVKSIPEFAGGTWEELRSQLRSVIPVGLIRSEPPKVYLCPKNTTIVAADDLLVFVGASIADLDHDLSAGTHFGYKRLLASGLKTELATAAPQRVLLLGWSVKIVDFIEALATAPSNVEEITILSLTNLEEREKTLSSVDSAIKIRHVEADYASADVVEPILNEGFSSIVFVASERLSEVTDRDARTILGFFQLTRLLPATRSAKARLVVELVDPENESILRYRRSEVVISPVIISHVMANIALRPELELVLKAIVSSRRYSLVFLNQAACGITGAHRFEQLRFIDPGFGFVPIGIRRKNRTMLMNPPAETQVQLDKGDAIIGLRDHNKT